jgi:hypothetical protein
MSCMTQYDSVYESTSGMPHETRLQGGGELQDYADSEHESVLLCSIHAVLHLQAKHIMCCAGHTATGSMCL